MTGTAERLAVGALLAALAAPLFGQDGEKFAEDQIKQGAAIYAQNCAPCHGPRMRDPDAAFDLRKFPPDAKGRFVNSIMKGKNQMPPWADLLKPADVDALWAYVITEQKQ
ncbi:MAG TPA: cytochrome c [Burkholderiales bacterium]|nr:cytochrome c [Burkholderiales bacterium]